jgi:hypothetical protein
MREHAVQARITGAQRRVRGNPAETLDLTLPGLSYNMRPVFTGSLDPEGGVTLDLRTAR